MTDDELNKWLHEKVVGECWHDGKWYRGWLNCIKCGASTMFKNPDYCQSLDAVSRVEQKVIEKLGEINGVNKLHFHLSKIMPKSDFYAMVASAAFATARQRAEACHLAMEANK